MKGRLLFVGLLVFLGFVFGCDYVHEAQDISHTPEVSIYATNPLGFIALWDSTYEDTNGNIVVVTKYNIDVSIDSVTFVSWNGVDAIIKGYMVKFFIPSEDSGKLVHKSGFYPLMHYIYSSTETDTIYNTVYNLPIYITDGIDSLFDGSVYPDPHTSLRMRVRFYGEDAYGYNKEFTVYWDYQLLDVSDFQ